jgi:two-component sensor histidine kinase
VAIDWTVLEVDSKRQLVVEWVERGGPEVKQPEKRGFGSRLLERMAATEGGTVVRTFDPEGLTCTLKFQLAPLDQASE